MSFNGYQSIKYDINHILIKCCFLTYGLILVWIYFYLQVRTCLFHLPVVDSCNIHVKERTHP